MACISIMSFKAADLQSDLQIHYKEWIPSTRMKPPTSGSCLNST